MRNMYLFVLYRDCSPSDVRYQVPLATKVVCGLKHSDLVGAAHLLITMQAMYCNGIFAHVYEFLDGHFVFSQVINF